MDIIPLTTSSASMSAELAQDFHLEIAHVLFMDIVGYSKLLINEQAELLQELNRIVHNTSQFRRAEAADELIRLPTGDGMALVFLRHAEAPVQCAIEISHALRSSPELQVKPGRCRHQHRATGDGLRGCGAHSSFEACGRRFGALPAMAIVFA